MPPATSIRASLSIEGLLYGVLQVFRAGSSSFSSSTHLPPGILNASQTTFSSPCISWNEMFPSFVSTHACLSVFKVNLSLSLPSFIEGARANKWKRSSKDFSRLLPCVFLFFHFLLFRAHFHRVSVCLDPRTCTWNGHMTLVYSG